MLRTIAAFAFLLLPLLEIAGFVVVGSHIGALATIGLVIASAILGSALIRRAGIDAMRRMQRELEGGGAPSGDIVDNAMQVVAGILLLIPGFITDIAGLMLLVPGVRRALFAGLRNRVTIVRGGFSARSSRPAPQDRRTIDLESDEYRHVDSADSPWRKGPEPKE